ncbi:uncharacterized protein [Eurosta solidaginis]|uniref:uncharacterized protein n=1 Tax=Eurosta solidaginis TaxID=178769 RepID=UPI0035311026
MYYQQICAFLIRNYVLVQMYITLLIPLPHLSWLTTMLRLGWLAWLAGPATKLLLSLMMTVYEKVSFMVGNVLYFLNIFTNVVTICEVMLKAKKCRRVLRLERELDELLQKQVDISGMELKVWLNASYHVILHIIYDVIHLGIAFVGYKSPVFYQAAPLMVVQRMRYVQIIQAIERQTLRSSYMIDALQVLVCANRTKYKYTSAVWQPYTLWEYERLNSLRLIQGRLCELHESVSNCYGWSAIVLIFTTFFTLVSNLFWCIIIAKNKSNPMQFFYNMMTMLRLGTMMTTLLVFGDRARRNNAKISCLINKLAKPFGNKI